MLTVREILAFGVEERMGARVELEDLAASTLTYRLSEGEPTATEQQPAAAAWWGSSAAGICWCIVPMDSDSTHRGYNVFRCTSGGLAGWLEPV